MSKLHRSAELPFHCGCCDYKSSSLRRTIDHFYNDHTASGTLMCPYCLRTTVVVANNTQLTANITDYLEHLKAHFSQENGGTRCQRCALSFIHKGASKVHQMFDHNSAKALQSSLRECCKNSVSIAKPKVSV